MSTEPDRSVPLSRKIYHYYSQHGVLDLIKEFGPFIAREIIRSQRLSAAEIQNESDLHRSWQEKNGETTSISEPNNQRLRQEFDSYPKEFYLDPATVYELKDCHLVGPHAIGLYKGHHLIPETSGYRLANTFLGSRINIIQHSLKSYFKKDLSRSQKSVFPLICPDPSYYHWMMEYLPKLRLLELYQERTSNEPVILIESNPRDFVSESLEAAGYDSSQYQEWENNNNMRVKNLITCTHRPHIFDYENPELSNYNPSIRDFMWLRNRMRSKVTNTDSKLDSSNRIYISRQNADRGRKIVNYDLFSDVLTDYGFTSYKLENLSFTHQLELFYEADIIMGPHGAGLLNMIFTDNPTIIELFPESMIKPHFYFISDLLGFEYKSMVTKEKNGNLILDIVECRKLIRKTVENDG